MSLSSRRGFTLVEILIVLAILAILLSVAMPNLLRSGKSARKNACILNLRQIDGAMEQWSVNNSISAGVIPSSAQDEEIYSYVDGGIPTCPSGGDYTIHAIGTLPQVTCSREDEEHKLFS